MTPFILDTSTVGGQLGAHFKVIDDHLKVWYWHFGIGIYETLLEEKNVFIPGHLVDPPTTIKKLLC